jgi:Crp-like helix-turn-helix domain
VIPKMSQETLAEMIGTTRSRVSFFMNRFRKLGFINYAGGAGYRFTVHFSTSFSTTSGRVIPIAGQRLNNDPGRAPRPQNPMKQARALSERLPNA